MRQGRLLVWGVSAIVLLSTAPTATADTWELQREFVTPDRAIYCAVDISDVDDWRVTCARATALRAGHGGTWFMTGFSKVKRGRVVTPATAPQLRSVKAIAYRRAYYFGNVSCDLDRVAGLSCGNTVGHGWHLWKSRASVH